MESKESNTESACDFISYWGKRYFAEHRSVCRNLEEINRIILKIHECGDPDEVIVMFEEAEGSCSEEGVNGRRL